MFVIPPPENDEVKGIAKLLRSMHGTRDAGQCFDAFSEKTMKQMSFSIGEFNPCVYANKERDAICVRHGDDFVLLGDRSTQDWFHEELGKRMICKVVGVLGP